MKLAQVFGAGCLGVMVLVGGCVALFGVGAAKVSRDRAAVDAKIERGAVEIETTADELVSTYKANEVRADERFRRRIVAVRGKISGVKKGLGDSPYVTLAGGAGIVGVQCAFDSARSEELAALNVGDVTTIVGECHGLFGNVHLRRCALKSD